MNLLKTNFIILIILLPIIININFKLSIFSIINSIIFSSIIFIIYPLFLITVWILPLQYFWSFIFKNLEKIISLLNLWNIELSIGEIKWYLILSYYLILLILFKLKPKNIKNIFLLTILIFSLSFLSINKNLNNQNIYKLTMFNVNHGLSVLLSNSFKKINILFDAGIGKMKNYSRNKIILNNLLKLGINKIDAVFISHNHKDHYNNLNFLKENINIQKIYTYKNPQKEYLINNLLIKNLSYNFYKKFKKENNRSLVLFFSLNNKNFLFPFDLEEMGEKELTKIIDKKIDILQVSHHGSKTSSTNLFINKIKPNFCLISANKISSIRKRLENYNCKVYNTYKRGNLILEINNNIKIKTQF